METFSGNQAAQRAGFARGHPSRPQHDLKGARVQRYNTQPKLIPPQSPHADVATELFIVEGESAADSVAAIRDEQTQAVLGLQGKPMNAFKASAARVADNPFFQALDQSLWLDEHRAHPRFARVVLLFDPDADGIHCCALMLAYFFKFQPEILTAGRLKIARAPEAVFSLPPRAGREPEQLYGYPDGTTSRLRRDLKLAGIGPVSQLVFRGLASIPPAILHKTCIAPATRKLSPASVDDAKLAISVFCGGLPGLKL